MKKVMYAIAVAAVLLSPLTIGGSVSAAGTCQIGYTGPNSDNLCVSTTVYACNVVNNTMVEVGNDNLQVTVTGDASGGSASTGSTTNNNGVTFTATVDNQDCSVVATVPATVVAPPTRTVEQKAPAPVVAPQKVTAKVLPNTDSASPLTTLGLVVGSLGAGAILVRLAMSLYTNTKS